MDPNRDKSIAYEDEDAKPVYDHYHASLAEYCREVTNRFQSGLLIDLHGQGEKRDTVFRGTRNGSTVKHLRETFGEVAFTGDKSFFGMLRDRGWKVFPEKFSDKEQSGFTGGYIVGTYGSSQNAVIDAYQLEFGAEYRVESRRQATAEQLADAVLEYSDAYLKLPKKPKAASL